MVNFDNEIKAYTLRNSLEYGKADAGKILPKLFQHGLDKKDIKLVMPKINDIVKNINSLSNTEKEKEFEKYKKYLAEKKEEDKGLPELEDAGKNMVFRLAPFPSGALHIGNAKTYLLNALYAEKYGAKTLLIMDDTIGSEEKPITPESYKLIQDAFDWLKVKYEKKIIYKSDRLEIYYEYAEKLIDKDKAYVCHCEVEELRKNRAEGKDCSCRQIGKAEQKKRWKEIFKLEEGKAVLRLKTSMQHPNPAFRDRVLFRIADRKHPRVGTKYRVWPTLEMTWAIDDHLLGITHIIRGNELMIETDMEKFIWDIFGWKHSIAIHTGLLRIEGVGAKISKSKAQKEVKSGIFSGWDDPRTWSIQSLIRRGISAESIREFVMEIGLNKQDIAVPIDALYSINRKKIDLEANRYSFIEEPVILKITGAPEIKEVEVHVHPDKKEMRRVTIKDIFVSKNDFESLSGKEIRLLHLYNIKIGKKSEYTSSEVKDIQKINWVSNGFETRILMPDGNWIEGKAEIAIKKLGQGEIIQFERFGFCRFDCVKNKKYEFWFAHK